MSAVWMRARAELRARWRSSVAAALLIGLGGGVVLGAIAMGRRTDTAYQRFLAANNGYDVVTSSGASGAGLSPLDIDAASRLPQVADRRITDIFFFGARTDSGEVLPRGESAILADPVPVRADMINRPKVLVGRLPNPARIDEVALGFQLANAHHIHVGEGMTVDVLPTATLPDFNQATTTKAVATLHVRIVGIIVVPGGFPPTQSYFEVFASTAFGNRYAVPAAAVREMFVKLHDPQRDLAAFKAALDKLAASPGREQFIPRSGTALAVERSTHLRAVVLWLFAGLAAATVTLIAGQLQARDAFLSSMDNGPLRALGVTSGQIVLLGVLRVLVIAVLGVLGALGVAVLLSPLGPLGAARLAEPSPGYSADALVLLLGGVAIILGVTALGAFFTWMRARRTARATRERARPSRIPDVLARASFRPSAVAGVRMAVETGSGPTSMPIRSTTTGLAIAVGALTVAIVFGSSLQHLLATPRLFGFTWDASEGNPFGPDLSRFLGPLSASPAVGAYFSGTTILRANITGSATTDAPVWGLDQNKGDVAPAVSEGRWVKAPDEIVLGSKIMRRVGTHVGGLVAVFGEQAGNAAPVTMRVVGQGVFPTEADETGGAGPGEAVGMTFDALRRLVPDAPRNVFGIRFAAGISSAEGKAAVEKIFNFDSPAQGPNRPSDLADLARVDGTPLILAALMGLLAVATLAHTLVATTRRRARDLAILKTLGFSRGQLSSTMLWQGGTLAVAGLIVAIPLGVSIGRWSWTLISRGLGFVPEPATRLLPLVAVVPCTIVAALIVGAIAAAPAARTRAAVILRAE